MDKRSKIFVAGHKGLVGSAILRALQKKGYVNIVTRTRGQLDLFNEKEVASFFAREKPEYIFIAAAKAGGIMANDTKPAEFIFENLKIQNNIIHNAYLSSVEKLLFLGSSCIYPKSARQPIIEKYLLTGPLEETNAPYAIAKIAGISMCQSYNRQYGTNFISAMPTNLYGPNDNFDLTTSHVIPAMLRKFHDAKSQQKEEVVLWGSGTPKREFLHVDDLAEALVFLMKKYDKSEIINIGTGKDISIKKLALMIKKTTGFDGRIVWDKTKPDGTLRKLLDTSKIRKIGWKNKIELKKGIEKTYKWYLENE
ncbi:MAG TPA: GDP-L-fucose synthase [Candidatus Paceibacterota bacterium]